MKIAIAGFGVEGKASFEYWNTPGNDVIIVDENEITEELPSSVKTMTGKGVFSDLNGFDLVIRTAGLASSRIKTDGKIWSMTNEFLAQCKAPIIGVTGTKGKGTTSSLIASILRASGKTVHLVGNIGVPALGIVGDITADDIVVYELSSFQLWDLEASPHVAVVLMIEADHLDVHKDFEDYVAAKAHITQYQLTTDRVVFNADNETSTSIARQSVGQLLPYPSERTAHVRDSFFYYKDTELCHLDQLLLPGEHNIQNACAAITAVWPWVQDPAVIAEGLRGFNGLPHRLKFVREVAGVKYYDDSIATTPGSAIAAIRSFGEPKVLILGGSDKGADYTELVELCNETNTVVIAIGQTGISISQLCSQYGVPFKRIDGGMNEVVALAHENALSGSVVILSPASASFDQYMNYSDRGDQFIAAVNQLREER